MPQAAEDKPSHKLRLSYAAWDADTLDQLIEHIQDFILAEGLSLEAGPMTRVSPGDHRTRPEPPKASAKITPMDQYFVESSR
jgi:hypothetical protein